MGTTRLSPALLDYLERDRGPLADPVALPLADEVHLEAWRPWAAEARLRGAVELLREIFVQLRFPISEQMATDPDYVAATRRGIDISGKPDAPAFVDPDGICIDIIDSPAGALPCIRFTARADFELTVRTITARNSPAPIPASMGACIIAGYNNWARIRAYRARWAASLGALASEAAWSAEFARLRGERALYQDRLLLLSSGPYSALPADQAGFAASEWLDLSAVIRREHELTHYLTLRLLGSMRNALLDELVADYCGLVAALGRYEGRLARGFLGLDRDGQFQSGGRLANYRGSPPLDDADFEALCQLAVAAIDTLEDFDQVHGQAWRAPLARARLVEALFGLPLQQLPEIGAHGIAEAATQRLAAGDRT